jgi:hypothetical protein
MPDSSCFDNIQRSFEHAAKFTKHPKRTPGSHQELLAFTVLNFRSGWKKEG